MTEWHEAGVWQKLHEQLLAELRGAGLLDLSAALACSPGGPHGSSPVDRRKSGSKHHLITDAGGIPLAVTLTGGNHNDVTQSIPLIDAVPSIRGVVGKPRSSGRAAARRTSSGPALIG